ncbi:MAG: hypothetical protein Ct9H90mP16_15940 [Candidatus Poseidoniales archaeon]|nr:MAG: hypothetical protein Ct9H90mP16_15940 [Candidatus Poseidoniales archaeon]
MLEFQRRGTPRGGVAGSWDMNEVCLGIRCGLNPIFVPFGHEIVQEFET